MLLRWGVYMSFHDRFLGIVDGRKITFFEDDVYIEEEGVEEDFFYDEVKLAVEELVFEMCRLKDYNLQKVDPLAIQDVVRSAYNKMIEVAPYVIAESVIPLLDRSEVKS